MCLMNGCIDVEPSCPLDSKICSDIRMQDFVNTNCRRTCNRCDIQPPTDPAPNDGNNNNNGGIVPPPPPPPVGGCTSYKPDTSPHCVKWNQNNFCASTFYTSEQKKQCTTTCKIC
ncbi:hypothetical protein WR25_19243 isoform F [Diploscapter pachys]|nr:hypothetical protein WR25_19243 isoform D [Diploscapter pachys]PAV91185.1 hypothetical protein WR25_19243 isoform F [Diploscapter pachys]